MDGPIKTKRIKVKMAIKYAARFDSDSALLSRVTVGYETPTTFTVVSKDDMLGPCAVRGRTRKSEWSLFDTVEAAMDYLIGCADRRAEYMEAEAKQARQDAIDLREMRAVFVDREKGK